MNPQMPYTSVHEAESTSMSSTLDWNLLSVAHSDEGIQYAIALQLIELQQYPQQLPDYLSQLNHALTQIHCAAVALVYCYPQSNECFYYHDQRSRPRASFLQDVQKQLLWHSQHLIQQQQSSFCIEIAGQHAQFLMTAHDHVIWRLSPLMPSDTSDLKRWAMIDAGLQRGLRQHVQQQQHISAILHSERRIFSADLHDSIAQIMGFLRLKSARLHQKCRQQEVHALLPLAEEVATYTHYAYQQVRDLITASRLTYQSVDFVSALKKVVEEFEHQSSIAFELDIRVSTIQLNSQQSIQLLYIVRESLSNVVRHSQARLVRLLLEIQEMHVLCLRIQDDGIGIRPQQKRHDSFGLEIMQERAERMGATLKIESEPTQGTCVQIQLTLASPINAQPSHA